MIEKIQSFFTSEVFILIMVQSSLAHKALRALKSIDEFDIFKNVNNSNISKRLKV
jgi:hypothetical protein